MSPSRQGLRDGLVASLALVPSVFVYGSVVLAALRVNLLLSVAVAVAVVALLRAFG